MPTATSRLTAAQLRKLDANLSAAQHPAAARWLLSVLTDESINNGYNIGALREVLKQKVVDVRLLELVENDLLWRSFVDKGSRFVGGLKTTAGRRELLEKNVVKVFARLLAPTKLSVVDVLGEQAGARISEVMCRYVVGVLMVRILRNNAAGSTGWIVSKYRMAAELGLDKDAVGRALKWSEANGMIRAVKQMPGGNWKYVLGDLSEGNHRRVMARYSEVVGVLVGSLMNEVRGDATEEDDEVDERMESRRERQRAKQIEQIYAPVSATNPFGDMFLSTWNPLGMLVDLEPVLSPVTAVDALLSIESVVWRPAFSDSGLTVKVWSSLFTGALGVDDSNLGSDASFDANRGNKAFGRGWVARLNEGASLRELIEAIETPDLVEKRFALVAERKAKRAGYFEAQSDWNGKRVDAERRLTELVDVVAKKSGTKRVRTPTPQTPRAKQNLWLDAMQAEMARRIAETPTDVAEFMSNRLVLRLMARGFKATTAADAVNVIIPRELFAQRDYDIDDDMMRSVRDGEADASDFELVS